MGAAKNTVNLLKETMKNWKTNLICSTTNLGVVKINRRIFQGYLLSPLLFVVSLLPLTRVLLVIRKMKWWMIWSRMVVAKQILTSLIQTIYRSSHPEVFMRKGVLKICSKFTGEHPCRSVISIKSQSTFIETTLRHGCSPINLLHIFRTPFPRNTSG